MPDWSRRVEEEGCGLARLLSLCLTLSGKEPALIPDALILVARVRRLLLAPDGALGRLRRMAEGSRMPDAERRRLLSDHHQFQPEAEAALRRILEAARRRDHRVEVETLETAHAVLQDRTPIRETLHGLQSGKDPSGADRDIRIMLAALEPLAPRYAEAEARLRAHAAQGVREPISTGSNGVV